MLCVRVLLRCMPTSKLQRSENGAGAGLGIILTYGDVRCVQGKSRPAGFMSSGTAERSVAVSLPQHRSCEARARARATVRLYC